MPSLSRRPTALLGLACVFWLACGKAAEPLPERPAEGWSATRLEVVDAARLRRAAAADGPREALVVALWAHWCDPCIEEMPELTALADLRPGWGVWSLVTDDVTSPSVASRVQAVLDKVAPRHAQGRIAPGGEHRILSDLGLEWDGVLPKTWVITARGIHLLDGRSRDEILTEVERHLRGPTP